MYPVKTATAVTSRPPYNAEGEPGFFTAGNAVAGIPATVPGEHWFNMTQEELLNVIRAAGLAPSATDDTQLAQAIMRTIAAAVAVHDESDTAHEDIRALLAGIEIPNATEAVAGIIRLATQAQVLAGAGGGAVTPETLATRIAALSIVPPGTVAHVAMSSAPSGWLPCNGALVSRTAYAALFAAIGTTYGVGNGSTTFGLPDLRGEFLRGLDSGRGVDPSRVLGSRQTGSIMGGDYDGVSGYSVLSSGAINPYTRAEVGLDAGVASDYPNALLSSAGQGNTYALTSLPLGWGVVRPRNVALLACIKY